MKASGKKTRTTRIQELKDIIDDCNERIDLQQQEIQRLRRILAAGEKVCNEATATIQDLHGKIRTCEVKEDTLLFAMTGMKNGIIKRDQIILELRAQLQKNGAPRD